MQSEEKFVAFIDVLGFKKMVEDAESGSGIPLTEIVDHLSKRGTAEDSSKFQKYGPTTCPQCETIRRDLNVKPMNEAPPLWKSTQLSVNI